MIPARSSALGFTLLEVLVALAIVSIGLMAAVRSVSIATSSVERSKASVIAAWVAEDRLAEHVARRSWPAPGEGVGRVQQAGREFVWRESVQPGSHQAVRILHVRVSLAAEPDHVLARLSGTLAGAGVDKGSAVR